MSRVDEIIQELQVHAPEPLVTELKQIVDQRRRILHLVQEVLAQLRLDLKYLMFDLESTRQERDAARAELDKRNDK